MGKKNRTFSGVGWDLAIPFAERFVFDGRIREVFAQPDRDVFWLGMLTGSGMKGREK